MNDGNGFGKTTLTRDSAENLSAWSKQLLANQDSFLHYLLSLQAEGENTSWHWSGDAYTNAGAKVQKTRSFRMELPLWGGDEIMMIVPAWCGWWTLASYFQHYGKLPWKEETGPSAPDGKPLTHGASIVFCHHNAPIYRVQSLAKELAEQAKRQNPEANRFTYQVLESFDHLGADIDTARKRRRPPILRNAQPEVLQGDLMLQVLPLMDNFRRRFPKSKLHDIVYELAGIRARGRNDSAELARADATECFNELQVIFGASVAGDEEKAAATGMHIADLWDYTDLPDWESPPIPQLAHLREVAG